jgi:hypothetical protein
MKTCLVRVQDTHIGVGLFWFETEEELSCMIDQIATPEACEYRLITGGGVFFDDIPLPNPDDEDNRVGPVATALSDMRGYDEGLVHELVSDGTWHPCVSSDGKDKVVYLMDWTE